MSQRSAGSASLVIMVLILAGIIAAANGAVLLLTVGEATGTGHAAALTDIARLCLPCVLYIIAAPLGLGIVAVLMLARTPAPAAAPASAISLEPAPSSPAPALRLLALLQQEARLLDFIEEDIHGYGDEQIGAAVRSIHAGCRKVIREHLQLQRVFEAEDGSPMVIEKGFDPAAVRLTGNVTGEPPFRGTLQHGGWRATKVSLPDVPSAVDPAIIAPAEVELP